MEQDSKIKQEVYLIMAIYGIKDCANLTLFDLATDKPYLFTDYANVSTNEWSSERVFATAKGSNAIGWDSNKTSTLVMETEVFDLKWLALLAGTEINKETAEISKREVVRVGAEKTAQLKGSAIAGSIQVVEVSQSDLVEHVGEALEEVKKTGEEAIVLGVGQYSVDGNTITFEPTVVEGTTFAVYYLVEQSDVRVITMSSDKFPKSFRIVADAMIREKETSVDEFVQIEYFNAKPQGNFTVTMSATEPTSLSATFDLFANRDKKMAEYKIIAE